MTIRHVVLVSAVLSMGSFVYTVGFAPMDEGVYGRAGAMNQTPSQGGLVATIRRSLAQRQMGTADRMADVLMLHNPEEPVAYFWRATVDEQMGNESSALTHWMRLDDFLEGLESWAGRYSARELAYFQAWSKFGVGDIEQSQLLFAQIADTLEARSLNGDGVVTNMGTLYNLACYRSMAGQFSEALGHWDHVVKLGYNLDDGWWAVDPDLKPLHEHEQFWETCTSAGQDTVGNAVVD